MVGPATDEDQVPRMVIAGGTNGKEVSLERSAVSRDEDEIN